MLACPKTRIDEAPTIQKIVDRGAAIQSIGRPITNRPVYNDFWVTTGAGSPRAAGSGAVILYFRFSIIPEAV